MIRPLGNRVLVRRDEPEKQTPGGILLPDTAKAKPTKGVVLAVGPGKRRDDGTRDVPDVSEGDTILFASYAAAGTDVTLDDEELVLLLEEDILAVVTA
jgi:chaperonin GroES